MSERKLLERIRKLAGAEPGPEMVAGIGDDCAICRPAGGGEDWLFTTDLLMEDVHVLRATHPPAAVGHKALARGLSDIAAMGGRPKFCLLSLALPPWAGTRWVDSFYRGFLQLARQTGTYLAGGDLARAEKLVCDIVVCGAVPQGKALRRNGARAGDGIYVSGWLGGSALGLATRTGAAWKRHLRPEPRLELGEFLRSQLHASAAMDLSDGLSLDLHRLCLESGVSAAIDQPLPAFPKASHEQVLHGGEDYELLFTVAAHIPVPPAFGGLPLTRIGSITEGRAGEVELFGKALPALGYDHFREET